MSACLPGTFGPNCNQVCRCSEKNQLCHPVSGSCYCAPGFHGLKCEHGMQPTHSLSLWGRHDSDDLTPSPVCAEGRYGPDCKRDCRCDNGGECDPFTGACECPAGFIGPHCNTSKSDSTFWKWQSLSGGGLRRVRVFLPPQRVQPGVTGSTAPRWRCVGLEPRVTRSLVGVCASLDRRGRTADRVRPGCQSNTTVKLISAHFRTGGLLCWSSKREARKSILFMSGLWIYILL